jgi:alpha-methylacyl-CoA racemase
MRLIAQADVLIEGFRPGVMERLGLGPDACFARNPGLVYGRMTGWGQEGPLAQAAGHDINYISLTGALHAIGRHGQAPVPPLNLVGDFGGGSMFLIMGVLAALVERGRSGKGQVVDAAMTDGSAALMTIFFGLKHLGFWRDERGVNMLDTGAHFYDVYETRDGRYVSVGSIEPQFYQLLLKHSGLGGSDLPSQFDRAQWPALKEKIAAIFRTKTRDEWCAIMENTDVCFAPVLSMSEAPHHPHNAARGTFTEVKGVVQPAPAPRFSRTPGAIQRPPAHPGQHTDEALADWGFSPAELARLREKKAIA